MKCFYCRATIDGIGILAADGSWFCSRACALPYGSAVKVHLRPNFLEEPIVTGPVVPRCIKCGVEWCEALDATYSKDPYDQARCAKCRSR